MSRIASIGAPNRLLRVWGPLVLVAGLAVAPPPGSIAQPPGAPEKMPVTGITLYRSGVGSFERRSMVQDDADVQLRFKTEQINDILKSMVLLDLDGGRIDTVSYGSKEPLERRLASFGVDISDDPAAGELLGRLRGTPIRLMTPEGEVSGTIMNVEMRPTIVGGGPNTPPGKHDLPWINLITLTGVKSINLTTVSGFQILDPALAEELNKALAALAEHRADRVKTVDLALRGQGARQIVVAYVHEMPVWKTSYRLVLPDQPEARADTPSSPPTRRQNNRGPDDPAPRNEAQPQQPVREGGQPTIQGWAIVENTTDEDWQDVRLSLVAGRPVSFQMDLYEPLHVTRPEVPVPMVAGVMPKVYQEGVDEVAMRDMQQAMNKSSVSGGRPRRAAGAGGETFAPAAAAAEALELRAQRGLSADDLTRYAAQAQAQAGEIGEVFQYTLKNPVNLERQRSAMLPILSAAIDGRRVSIYNRGDSPEHPMRGVELKNSTGLQLMPGPISVFDGAAYAGDAQIGHVSVGDKRLLSYAVDLDVTAQVKDESSQNVRRIRIVNGMLEITTRQIMAAAYGLSNKDQKRPRTILVEHPKVPGWDLVEPAKAAEETQNLYRFELVVDAGQAGAVRVQQERTDHSLVAVVGYDLGVLLAYMKDGKVSQKVVDAVREAARLQATVIEWQRKIEELDREAQAITNEQSRIRPNMQSIERNTDLYRRYVTKLNDQETRLEAIAKERAAAQTEYEKARAALEVYVGNLNVE